MTDPVDPPTWEPRLEAFAREALAAADAAHDLAHIRRVVAAAKQLAAEERARLDVVLPAAWLHDCVVVPKDSPDRARASTLAAERATAFLREVGYPGDLPAIAHAIAAHSFSAQIAPETVEAEVVQDADRLDALGAIGLARCLMTGVAMGGALYCEADPFAHTGRALDDRAYSIDHFPLKLLRLPQTMRTAAGRAEAARRADAMRAWVRQLARELGEAPPDWLT